MIKRHLPSVILVAIVAIAFLGCRKPAQTSAEKIEPAHVAHHVDENDLNTITLTQKAEERLGIVLAEAKLTEVRRRRTIGGEIVLPPGQSIVVTAPIAGTISQPDTGPVPMPGTRLKSGQALLKFMPLLSPERQVLTPSERVRVAQTRADVATAQIEAERQIESAEVGVQAAQIAYDRAQQLLRSKAGSQRTVDETHANLQLAEEAMETAQARHKLLSGIKLDEEAGELKPLLIESPVDGILQALDSAPGESVAAGEVLLSVMKTDRVWVRVPVYVGSWRDVDTTATANIAEFGSPQSESREAAYVSAPPSADPIATTVDLFYELGNADGKLYPGQKMSVTLPMSERTDRLVVPFNAVLYDVHGGQWVYEQQDEHVFARRRISVDHIDGENAVLSAGLGAGSKVVTDGAAELFGTEFGVGH